MTNAQSDFTPGGERKATKTIEANFDALLEICLDEGW